MGRLYDKIFKKDKQVSSLLNLCIDSIILSRNPALLSEIIHLPDCVLTKFDQRYFQMEHTKAYKKRFISF